MPAESTSIQNQDDGLIKAIDHSISLAAFEGPLDLLLFLIRRNEIDIYDIPIREVTTQYLDALRKMESLKLDVAGEFFVMAATLMQIKSRLLLPKEQQTTTEEEEEADVDPRWELVQQLIEYKRFKEASFQLSELAEQASNVLARQYRDARADFIERPLKPTDRIELWNTFNQVLRRLSEKITVGQIHDETVSVADRMEFILETITHTESFLFSDLFKDRPYTVNHLIATFLAILELTRLKRLVIIQESNFADIRCNARRDDEADPTLPIETDFDTE